MVSAAVREAYRGTGIARRTGGLPATEYILKRRPTQRQQKVTHEVVLDLGAKLGICWRCTCPVHEADITDGYAIICEDGSGRMECKQDPYAENCAEYRETHLEEVAAMEKAAAEAAAAAAEGATSDEVVDGQAAAPSTPVADAAAADAGAAEDAESQAASDKEASESL